MEQRRIRNSAKALIFREGKVAAVKIQNHGETWYVLPGGGQEVGETLPEAVRREVAEELGLDVRAEELAFVVEGVQGERFQRVDLVFRCAYLGEIPGAAPPGDTHQVGWDWLDVGTLREQPLYPSRLRGAIGRLYRGEPQGVYLGNENAGDPEVLD